MPELQVSMPFSKIEALARHLGSQDTNVCPDTPHDCWLTRELQGYLHDDPTESECAECWMRFILMGD